MKNNFRKSKKNNNSSNFDQFSSFNRGGYGQFHGEMHKATCADCGKECQVPFVPKEGRPVYCRDCYSKHKPQKY